MNILKPMELVLNASKAAKKGLDDLEAKRVGADILIWSECHLLTCAKLSYKVSYWKLVESQLLALGNLPEADINAFFADVKARFINQVVKSPTHRTSNPVSNLFDQERMDALREIIDELGDMELQKY